MYKCLHAVCLSRSPANATEMFCSLHASLPASLKLQHHLLDGTQLDLFQAYNSPELQAEPGRLESDDPLLFVHDDVEFLGAGIFWPPILDLLKKPFTGFIGVAGALQIPEHGCWWRQDHANLRGMVAHPTPNPHFPLGFNTWPWGQAQFGPVAAIDGCCFLTTPRTLSKIGGFDSEHYQGYHFYDLDTSFRATLAGLTNYVAPLPILHKSLGVPNENWEQNRKIFVERHAPYLPYILRP